MRASGGATGERSTYPPLINLLNAVGSTLQPKVFCISEMKEQGAGHPDVGLYGARQVQKGRRREGQIPERGVVEVKPAGDDAWLTAESDQVSRYWDKYRLALVTNTCDFVLLGEDTEGKPVKLETFRLSESAEAFESRLEKPRAFTREVGASLGEYLCRALSHHTTLAEPKDLAWLLASYARDSLARVEATGDTPSLAALRSALEETMGVRFEGERGAAFFLRVSFALSSRLPLRNSGKINALHPLTCNHEGLCPITCSTIWIGYYDSCFKLSSTEGAESPTTTTTNRL